MRTTLCLLVVLLLVAAQSATAATLNVQRGVQATTAAPVATIRVDNGPMVANVSALSGGLSGSGQTTPLQFELTPGALPALASWLVSFCGPDATYENRLSGNNVYWMGVTGEWVPCSPPEIRLRGRGWETILHGAFATVEYPGLNATGVTPLRLAIGTSDVASRVKASALPETVAEKAVGTVRVTASGVDFTGLSSMTPPAMRRVIDSRPTETLLRFAVMEPVHLIVPLDRMEGFLAWSASADMRDVHIQYLQPSGAVVGGIVLKNAKAKLVGLAPVSAGSTTRSAEVVVEYARIEVAGSTPQADAGQSGAWKGFSDGSARAKLASVEYQIGQWPYHAGATTGIIAADSSQKLVHIAADLELLTRHDVAESVNVTLVDGAGARFDSNNALYERYNSQWQAIEGERTVGTRIAFHAVVVAPRDFQPRTVIFRPASSSDETASFAVTGADIPAIPVPYAVPAQSAVALSEVTVPRTGQAGVEYPMLSFSIVGTPTISTVANATFGGTTGNYHVITLTVRNKTLIPQSLDDATFSLRGNYANGSTEVTTAPYEQNSSAAVSATVAHAASYTIRYVLPQQAANNLSSVVIEEGNSRKYSVAN